MSEEHSQEIQEVWWCETHARSGFRFEDGYGYCDYAEKDACSMVPVLMVHRSQEGDSQ